MDVGWDVTFRSGDIVTRAVSAIILSQPDPVAVTITLYQVIPAVLLGG